MTLQRFLRITEIILVNNEAMSRYAKIVDRGECISSSGISVNGVPANKYEWAKYNFYPQNGMVGEIIPIIPNIATDFVLKILDGIYVPMTPQGIVEISSKEFEENKHNNVCVGMDARQQRINDMEEYFRATYGKLPW